MTVANHKARTRAIRKVDVVIASETMHGDFEPSLRRIVECSEPMLGRLVVLTAGLPREMLDCAVSALPAIDSRISVPSCAALPVPACACAVAERRGDVVLLAAGTWVTDGWLSELASVAHAEERTAGASPLSNDGGLFSVPTLDAGTPASVLAPAAVEIACRELPRFTSVPRLDATAVYLRDDVLDAVGQLDPAAATIGDAVFEWTTRRSALGFRLKRANRALVLKTGPRLPLLQDPHTDVRNGTSLARSVVDPEQAIGDLKPTLEAAIAAHAVQLHVEAKIKVALDLRHVPPAQVGTRTHALGLAHALAKHPEIDLTLLVNDPAQAAGLEKRTLTEAEWCDDVALIHKPAQIFDKHELRLLFESSAHVVITFQDMIAYHIAAAFEADVNHQNYRTTCGLLLSAAQHVIVFSQSTAEEVCSEFAIPREEMSVIPLGVEADQFMTQTPGLESTLSKFCLPDRYFFSIATDLPHKNLASLIAAYQLVRSRWRGDEPPGLALAGHALGSRRKLYDGLRSGPVPEGLKLLGPVSADELRVLYQNAVALVYPSLYEGFGLPPLEAMAAGTPVIAMPVSSIPEVVCDGAFYAPGLAVEDLAVAMERVATDAVLREDLCERGKRRVLQFRWENTARDVVNVYRRVVLAPSHGSLMRRRLLSGAIRHWAEPPAPVAVPEPVRHVEPPPLGILNALGALNGAVNRRLRRELGRLPVRA